MVLGARTRYATRFALFRVQIFRGSPLDHENHENITPQKYPLCGIYIYIYRDSASVESTTIISFYMSKLCDYSMQGPGNAALLTHGAGRILVSRSHTLTLARRESSQ